MNRVFFLSLMTLLFFGLVFTTKAEKYVNNIKVTSADTTVLSGFSEKKYWLLLERKSNIEYLFFGVPGDREKSQTIKVFSVKSGVPGERPTPLPQLAGKEYWTITDKWESKDNPETAPYFLKLDVPVTDTEPYGPAPYLECGGPARQCNWEVPGFFGLHGINGNREKLSEFNPGSSGCIRHNDEDILFLYDLLDPQTEGIRYYISNL